MRLDGGVVVLLEIESINCLLFYFDFLFIFFKFIFFDLFVYILYCYI